MSKFLRLTNFILNSNDINRIVINPNKYHIFFTSEKNNGFGLCFYGFGFGGISSNVNELEICETNHPNDYKMVTDWINKNS